MQCEEEEEVPEEVHPDESGLLQLQPVNTSENMEDECLKRWASENQDQWRLIAQLSNEGLDFYGVVGDYARRKLTE